MHTFTQYTNLTLNILRYADDDSIISNRLSTFESMLSSQQLSYDSVLFIGFSPWIFCKKFKHVYVTQISPEACAYLTEKGVNYTVIPWNDILTGRQTFECTVAIDEFTTFTENEIKQRELVTLLSDLTDTLLVTTLRDYKNMPPIDREFSKPFHRRSAKAVNSKIVGEYHDHSSTTDRYAWVSRVYELSGADMVFHGEFNRRAMFFKQLAKFTTDAGADKFSVIKQLMYQNLSRTDLEYIIGIRF